GKNFSFCLAAITRLVADRLFKHLYQSGRCLEVCLTVVKSGKIRIDDRLLCRVGAVVKTLHKTDELVAHRLLTYIYSVAVLGIVLKEGVRPRGTASAFAVYGVRGCRSRAAPN